VFQNASIQLLLAAVSVEKIDGKCVFLLVQLSDS
jgi:hypothetical protein